MHSSLPPAIKKHSSYQVKLQKEVKSTQNSQTVKKGVAHAKKDSIKVAVMVGKWQNLY